MKTFLPVLMLFIAFSSCIRPRKTGITDNAQTLTADSCGYMPYANDFSVSNSHGYLLGRRVKYPQNHIFGEHYYIYRPIGASFPSCASLACEKTKQYMAAELNVPIDSIKDSYSEDSFITRFIAYDLYRRGLPALNNFYLNRQIIRLSYEGGLIAEHWVVTITKIADSALIEAVVYRGVVPDLWRDTIALNVAVNKTKCLSYSKAYNLYKLVYNPLINTLRHKATQCEESCNDCGGYFLEIHDLNGYNCFSRIERPFKRPTRPEELLFYQIVDYIQLVSEVKRYAFQTDLWESVALGYTHGRNANWSPIICDKEVPDPKIFYRSSLGRDETYPSK